MVRAFTAAHAGTVLLPGQAGYANALGRLFSSEASLAQPICITQPEDCTQVATILRIARDCGCPVTVRGGGLSPQCAVDGAVMIDLTTHLSSGTLIGDDARMGGGATMGDVLDILSAQSRLIPVGVARIPGMGLALRGGVGYLTRSAGVTLDHVREVEIVAPSGDVLTLSDDSRGDEADLWWAVRGAAPHFGVVTSVTFRSRPSPTRVFVKRLVYPLDALPAYFELAPALPRDVSASALLGRPQDPPGAPVLFLYIVHAGDGKAGIARVQQLTDELTRLSGTRPLLELGETLSYYDLPPYDVPALGGLQSKAATASADPRWGATPTNPASNQRLFKFEKCPFLKFLDATAAAGLVEAIQAAPTSLCRVDLQHCGGALSDVAPTATAFWNRDFEWNCPIIGAWVGPDGEREECTDWVRQTMQVLAPYTVGAYSVEISPGLPETAKEVEQAFGGNLARLQALKRKWDPDNLFHRYYPV
jgi:FAD/FMN-containing dehydrogenase